MAKKVRFAIVAAPDTKCEYCLMLSSRDAVYRSADTAEASKHTNCNCEVVPLAAGQTMPGYDPMALFSQWKELASVREASGYSVGKAAKAAKTVKRAANTTKEAFDEIFKLTGSRDIESLQKWLNESASIKILRDRCAQIERWSQEIGPTDFGKIRATVESRKRAFI